MEVGTMKKTEYLALNPSVDPASVSELGTYDLYIYCLTHGSGFMMEDGNTYKYWHDAGPVVTSLGATIGYSFNSLDDYDEQFTISSSDGARCVMVDRPDVIGTMDGYGLFQTMFHVVF